jgi:hypothetical protein
VGGHPALEDLGARVPRLLHLHHQVRDCAASGSCLQSSRPGHLCCESQSWWWHCAVRHGTELVTYAVPAAADTPCW